VNGKLEAEDAGGSINTCPCSEGFVEFEISSINFEGAAAAAVDGMVRGMIEVELVVMATGKGDRCCATAATVEEVLNGWTYVQVEAEAVTTAAVCLFSTT